MVALCRDTGLPLQAPVFSTYKQAVKNTMVFSVFLPEAAPILNLNNHKAPPKQIISEKKMEIFWNIAALLCKLCHITTY